MTWLTVLSVFLTGVSLAMDAFAVSVCDGMIYRPLTKRRAVFIPAVFGVFQAVMPIIGFYIGFAFDRLEAFDSVDHWIAFALLTVIGGHMIFDGIKDLRAPQAADEQKRFSIAEVLVQGVATSIDALFVGFGFTAMLDGAMNIHAQAFISVAVIGVTTFAISAVGVLLGKKLGTLFRKKAYIAEIIGGAVLILLAIKTVVTG